MSIIFALLIELACATDQPEIMPTHFNNCSMVTIVNQTPYPLELEPDDLSHRYFKDANRVPVFLNIFYLNFPGYDIEYPGQSGEYDYVSIMTSLSNIASLTLSLLDSGDLLLKIMGLDKSESFMYVRLKAIVNS